MMDNLYILLLLTCYVYTARGLALPNGIFSPGSFKPLELPGLDKDKLMDMFGHLVNKEASAESTEQQPSEPEPEMASSEEASDADSDMTQLLEALAIEAVGRVGDHVMGTKPDVQAAAEDVAARLVTKFSALEVDDEEKAKIVNATLDELLTGSWNPLRPHMDAIKAALAAQTAASGSRDEASSKQDAPELARMQRLQQIITLAQEAGLLDVNHTVTAAGGSGSRGAKICMCLS